METIDTSRQVATSDDSEFTLTNDDTLAFYAAAGVPPHAPATSSDIVQNKTIHPAATEHARSL